MSVLFQQDFDSDSAGFSTPGGANAFYRSGDQSHSGSHGFFGSGESSPSDYEAQFTVNLAGSASLIYWHKAEGGGTTGHSLLINDVLIHQRDYVNGSPDWVEETVSLSPGVNVIKFRSTSDAGNGFSDGVFIDDVSVTSEGSLVTITASNDSSVAVIARRTDGTGGILQGEVIGGDAVVKVPPAPASETVNYIVVGRKKIGSEYLISGAQIVSVEQANVSSLFLTPSAGTVTLTVNSEASAEVLVTAIGVAGYLVTTQKATVSGGGVASIAIPDAASFGKTTVRYKVLVRKRNSIDPRTFDWINHGMVDVSDSAVSITLGASS
ncbi:hypothetical protein [Roseiconus lacunae]|uniref:hypothetical protein n=1 Tax=Roseiconus lacunae TaxID=2605694 RepID=UPI001E59EF22|nr:hypothetical protein [Roseiconus lacunae]MCD0459119.1 hypothetical protein [Roseiconus lacunae]